VTSLGLLGRLALVFLTACSINHRSGEFTCEKNADCDGDRICQQGLCVVTGNNPNDGGTDGPTPPDGPPEFRCPAQCTSCVEATKTCRVDCGLPAGAALCNQQIICPEGFNCIILCSRNATAGNAQCQQKIDCQNAESCKVDCTGTNTCKQIVCGEGPCDVACTGSGTCSQVDCDASCQCDVECSFTANCANVSCPGENFTCTGIIDGCDSTRQGCNTCN
jgi:hypothetical protein